LNQRWLRLPADDQDKQINVRTLIAEVDGVDRDLDIGRLLCKVVILRPNLGRMGTNVPSFRAKNT
jgi:hypothetical protein